MKKIIFVQTNYPGFLDNFEKKFQKKKISYRTLKKYWDDEWFGQSNFYSQHLNKLGWSGEEVVVNSALLQSSWAKEHHFNISFSENKWLKKLPESVKNILGTRGWVKEVLFKQVETIKPDVLYIHDMALLNTADINRIKKTGCLVVGQVACPLPINQKPLKEFDLIISSFPHYVRRFRRMKINSEYLRWCFEKEILTDIGEQTKKYDVVFVGGYSNAHNNGNKTLETLARHVPVDFWGYGEKFLSPTSAIRQRFHGMVWGKEMYRVFSQAKIVVNRHIDVAGKYANNMRMFDVTGVGTLLITDDKPNLNEFFTRGKEVVVYKNTTDLVNKTKYYLKNETMREKIARAGQKRTLNEHAYQIRMRELDQILHKYLKRRDKTV